MIYILLLPFNKVIYMCVCIYIYVYIYIYIPGEGKGYPLQYSGLQNTMDHVVYGVAKSWT